MSVSNYVMFIESEYTKETTLEKWSKLIKRKEKTYSSAAIEFNGKATILIGAK